MAGIAALWTILYGGKPEEVTSHETPCKFGGKWQGRECPYGAPIFEGLGGGGADFSGLE